jgi:hypothetical protein
MRSFEYGKCISSVMECNPAWPFSNYGIDNADGISGWAAWPSPTWAICGSVQTQVAGINNDVYTVGFCARTKQCVRRERQLRIRSQDRGRYVAVFDPNTSPHQAR